MSGNNTQNAQALIVAETWTDEIEEILHEKLLEVNIARVVDFPDGEQLTMPSISAPVARSRTADGDEFTYDSIDSGEVTIVLRDEVYAANSISKKLRQDSRWIDKVASMLPAEQAHTIMERYVSDLLALANYQFAGQNNANVINGAPHRFVAKGTNSTMSLPDFAAINYIMSQSKIPSGGMIGIVDPSVAYALDTLTNVVNVSNNPRFEGLVETGIAPDMTFVKSVYGIDLYTSNLLSTANETINTGSGARTTTNGVANIFMNVSDQRLLPFTAAWKETPTTKSEIDFDTDDLKTVTTARWGNGLTRDENLVVVLTNKDQTGI